MLKPQSVLFSSLFLRLFAIVGLVLSAQQVAHAQDCHSIFDPRYPGLQQCTVSIDPETVQANPDSQRRTLWCWAASMSMIYSSLGHTISQQSIVTQVYGAPENYPSGSLVSFNRNLNRSYEDDSGKRFVAHASAIRTPEEAIEALSTGKPIIYTTSHHATVQTSLTYQVAPGGPIVPKGGRIWDPEPNAGWRPLSASDISTYLAAWAISVSSTPSSHITEKVTPQPVKPIDLCTGLKKAVSLAPTGFKAIRSSKQGVGSWATSFTLEGFSTCKILDFTDEGDLALICEKSEIEYDEMKKSLRACLPGWEETPYKQDDGGEFVQFKDEPVKTMVQLSMTEDGAKITVEK